ncbi:MAG: ATP-binding cassette domain-containing protein, partial [Ruminococcus sp.]|nr:ATP-binding cassette domain-containing protein [Ruminococcus sp.]
MSQINVKNLTFCYDGSFDNIFENVSFSIDTNWKLGFIGRNGKGKTTFLRLLMGEYQYSGSIDASVQFGYFPYVIDERQKKAPAADI